MPLFFTYFLSNKNRPIKMSGIINSPLLNPSLLLDFHNTKRFHPAIDHKRNAIIFQDNVGSVGIAYQNTPRYREAPLGKGPRGIMIRSATTNYVPDNTNYTDTNFGKEGHFTGHITETNAYTGPRGAMAHTFVTTAQAATPYSRGVYSPLVEPIGKATSFGVYVKQAGTVPTNASVRIGWHPGGTGDNFVVNLYCDFKTIVDEKNRRAFPVGDGWWRVEVSGVVPAEAVSVFSGVWLCTAANELNISGAGYGLSISLPTVETSGIASTSVITAGSQVTTVADDFYLDVSRYIGKSELSYAAVTYSDMDARAPVRFCNPNNNYNDWLGMAIYDTLTGVWFRDSVGDKFASVLSAQRPSAFARNVSVCSFTSDPTACHGVLNGEYLPNRGATGTPDPGSKTMLRIGVNGTNIVGATVVEKIIVWPKALTKEQMLAVAKML